MTSTLQEHLFDLSAYQFDLPQELIAQKPVSPRDHSRLLIVNRETGEIRDTVFHEISHLLESGDRVVFNNTKVIPARLFGKKESGANVELLLTKNIEKDTWEALARPAKKMPLGTRVFFSETFFCEVITVGLEGIRGVRFHYEGCFWDHLKKYGQMPLPKYIHRNEADPSDISQYQTVYATEPGAVAAPTAGLHFTQDLLHQLKDKGVFKTEITLHVGLGTFRPVQTEDIRNHPMHYETCSISHQASKELNDLNGKRQILVGTTCCRTLESAASDEGLIRPGQFDTNLFIYPGYRFKYTKHLLTNFHLPGSTLLMLVSAFAGHELMMEAYQKAIEKKFRFFSYGDAMLIL